MAKGIHDEVIIAIADLSGSMAGPAIAKINVQLSELLAELKSMQEMAENSIRFGILSFHELQNWVIEPEEVDRIENLPQLSPVYGADKLGRRSDYAGMLEKLNKCMTAEFLCKSRTLNSVHILLFTDGCPTDQQSFLNRAMEDLLKNQVFSSPRTKRYVILERTENVRFHDRDIYLKVFTGNDQNVVSSDDFSALLSEVTGELEGLKKMESVFG